MEAKKTKRMKNNLKKIALFLPLFILTLDALARAGGGGGGGSSSGKGGPLNLISLIVAVVYSIVVSYLLYLKVEKSKNVVRRISAQDSFWNYAEMRQHARTVFFKMQAAWRKRDIDMVHDIITPRLYGDYKVQLENMIQAGQINILSGINIQKVRIIGCEDYRDDKFDRYVAYISGEMLDYTIDEKTKTIVQNEAKKVGRFVDTYHFVRNNDQWILDYIDNDVTLFDIVRTQNFKQ